MGLALALILSSLQCNKRYPRATTRGRRVKKRRKGDSLEIPLDLQIAILARLPAKSLMRFKCVSKRWSCLIRSRYFTNLYHTVASPPRRPRLYMSLVDHVESTSSMDCHNPRESMLISLSSSSSSSDNAKSLVPDLTMPGMGGYNMVVLRGLILCIVGTNACIYNPATRQSVTLPAVKSKIFAQKESENLIFYFLGHDPVLDQYKVVCAVVVCSEDYERITSEHWVLVLEAGGSWKRVEFDQHHVPTRLGLCINGVIYYLAATCMSRGIVVSFDVRSLGFNMIQVPPSVAGIGKFTGFIEYGGKPAIFDHTHLGTTGLVDLWVLEDGGRWSTKSLVLQPCQMNLFGNNISFIVHGTTQKGEVILTPVHFLSPFYIFYYDLQNNDLRKVRVRGIPDHWFVEPVKVYTTLFYYFNMMDKSESIMHLET